jgi:hypothetical protein
MVRVEQDEASEEVCPRPFEGGAVRIEVSLHRIVIDRQDNVRALGEEGGERATGNKRTRFQTPNTRPKIARIKAQVKADGKLQVTAGNDRFDTATNL